MELAPLGRLIKSRGIRRGALSAPPPEQLQICEKLSSRGGMGMSLSGGSSVYVEYLHRELDSVPNGGSIASRASAFPIGQ